MKTIVRRLLIPLALVVAGMAGAFAPAHAQIWPFWPWCPPNIITCNYIPGPITVVVNGVEFTGTSSGQGSFLVVSSAGGPGTTASVSYVPQSISAVSNFNGYGPIQTTLAQNTQTVISSTTANIPGTLYPARSTMSFYATASLPDGTQYLSNSPVTLIADNANSFGPFQNEPFHLQQPVTFGNANAGFTLTRLDATFNN